MNEIQRGVHEIHCCLKHGCKYSNPACPVESAEIRQAYPCEWCDEERSDVAKQIGF